MRAGKTVTDPNTKENVHANVVAPNHQHFFNFRLDMSVDGANISVYEVDSIGLANVGWDAFVRDKAPRVNALRGPARERQHVHQDVAGRPGIAQFPGRHGDAKGLVAEGDRNTVTVVHGAATCRQRHPLLLLRRVTTPGGQTTRSPSTCPAT